MYAAVRLEWLPNPSAEQITNYTVFRSGTSGAAKRLVGNVTNYIQNGLAPFSSNNFWITAENSSGTSAPSRTVTWIEPAQVTTAEMWLESATNTVGPWNKEGYYMMNVTNPAGQRFWRARMGIQ